MKRLFSSNIHLASFCNCCVLLIFLMFSGCKTTKVAQETSNTKPKTDKKSIVGTWEFVEIRAGNQVTTPKDVGINMTIEFTTKGQMISNMTGGAQETFSYKYDGNTIKTEEDQREVKVKEITSDTMILIVKEKGLNSQMLFKKLN